MAESKSPVSPDSEWGSAEAAPPHFVLQLFVAGSTPRSLRAVENLRHVFEEYIPGR